MRNRERRRGGTVGVLLLAAAWLVPAPETPAADVLGYSIIKGEFLLQPGPSKDDLQLDPLFGFSLMTNVEIEDLDRLNSARLRMPAGDTLDLEDYGDYWSILDSYETAAALDETYPWGDYVFLIDAVKDGKFSCLVELPETALPPRPYLVNFQDIQAVDASKPLTLKWEFDGTPATNDFVQVYVDLGHAEIYSTPNVGEPGALRASDRTVTIPAEVLIPGAIHSLNLEITRIVSTNLDCHPSAQGSGAVFRSTELDLWVPWPPEVRWVTQTTNGLPAIEVVADPEQTVVLQSSVDLQVWSNLATNAATSGTNVFEIPSTGDPRRFFRTQAR